MVLKIGLTGGIGSGKSTACSIFSELGVPIIDADIIANKLVQPGMPALKSIAKVFGEQVINKDGCLDRVGLRNKIFLNKAARKKLEGILHPIIYKKIANKVQNINAMYCIISIPLLLETNASKIVDRILVIDISKELQLSRASARDNVEKKDIDMIIHSQISPDIRKAAANDIINNSGSIEYLHKKIHDLHVFYTGS